MFSPIENFSRICYWHVHLVVMPFDEVVDGVNNRMKGSHYKDPNNDREWNKG